MKIFKDLIDAGVAPIKHTFIEKPTPSSILSFGTTYNNIYGLATNTNATFCDECKELVITGSLIRETPSWERFLVARQWGGVEFVKSLTEWVTEMGFVSNGEYIMHNGAPAYKFVIANM